MDLQTKRFEREQSALVWAAPATFFYLLGVPGWVLGSLAGVACARREASPTKRTVVAVMAYLAVIAVCLGFGFWLGATSKN